MISHKVLHLGTKITAAFGVPNANGDLGKPRILELEIEADSDEAWLTAREHIKKARAELAAQAAAMAPDENHKDEGTVH